MTDTERRPGTSIPLHELLNLEFTWQEGPGDTGEVRMPVRPEAFGFTGNLHGGAIATMVDLACALAAARTSGHDPKADSLVTADMHVRYLGRPRTDTVVAKAKVAKSGSQLIVVTCEVTDDEGHLIAVADFSMMKVPMRRPLQGGEPGAEGAPQL